MNNINDREDQQKADATASDGRVQESAKERMKTLMDSQGRGKFFGSLTNELKRVRVDHSQGASDLAEKIKLIAEMLVEEEGATDVSAMEMNKMLKAGNFSHHKTPNYIGTIMGGGLLGYPVIWRSGKKRYVITQDEAMKEQLLAEFGRYVDDSN